MKHSNISRIVYGATVAALYVLLTYISALLGISSGAVQLRLSEALTVLPIFLPSAVPGLFAGCVIANLLTGSAAWDIVLGSIATLLGAIGTRILRKRTFLSLLPPIIANTLIVPPVIFFVYGSEMALWLTYICVFAGEVLSCGVLGFLLLRALKKIKFFNTEL